MSVLVPTENNSVTIPAQVAEQLVRRGNGDAALLYIALLRTHGALQPQALAGDLRWERSRVEAAEAVLRELRLIMAPAGEVPPAPADRRPEYSRDEIADRLERNQEFRGLTGQVERVLGKQLSVPDLKALLGLYDFVGLPADVLYLLVCHCATRVSRNKGEGRKPSIRQIEKEGYIWAGKGLDTLSAATEYVEQYEARMSRMPQYKQALRLGSRQLVAGEESYIITWQEWGFPPESVAIAYEKTIMRFQELKWAYCNGILKNWHEDGLHTPEEIEKNDTRPAAVRSGSESGSDEMLKYAQKLLKDGK